MSSETDAENIKIKITLEIANDESSCKCHKESYIMYQAREYNRIKIKSIYPSEGPILGGNTILIMGYGFKNATSIMFGFCPVNNFIVASDRLIKVYVPQSKLAKESEVPISVITPTTESNDNIYYHYRGVIETPKIEKINPDKGTIRGGDIVTLIGTGFGNDMKEQLKVFCGKTGANIVFLCKEPILQFSTPATNIPETVDVYIKIGNISSNKLKYTYKII